MVASDTVVGLVGAGILLVALVGVFIVESRTTSTNTDLEANSYETKVSGDVWSNRQTGTVNPANGACVAPLCAPARTSANLTLDDAPTLGSRAFYVAFLTKAGGSDPYLLGKLDASGASYKINLAPNAQDRQAWESVLITLENSATPTTPSDRAVVAVKYGPITGDGEANDKKPVAGNGTFSLASGTAKSSLRVSGGSLTGDVSLAGATNHSGFGYRLWFRSNTTQGINYTFAGNLSGDATKTSLSVNVQGTFDDFDQMLVTLEAVDEPTTGPAIRPGGPTVFRALV